MCLGVLRLQPDGFWLETNTKDTTSSHRMHFQTESDTPTELLVYDRSRDIHLRFDYAEKLAYYRFGSDVPWKRFRPITRIVDTTTN